MRTIKHAINNTIRYPYKDLDQHSTKTESSCLPCRLHKSAHSSKFQCQSCSGSEVETTDAQPQRSGQPRTVRGSCWVNTTWELSTDTLRQWQNKLRIFIISVLAWNILSAVRIFAYHSLSYIRRGFVDNGAWTAAKRRAFKYIFYNICEIIEVRFYFLLLCHLTSPLFQKVSNKI